MPSKRQLRWSANIRKDKAQCAKKRANLLWHQCGSQFVPALKLARPSNMVSGRPDHRAPKVIVAFFISSARNKEIGTR